jgi:REP element-mobilizing transposase RayT
VLPQRKHIRLRDFDYSSANGYFVTVCVKNREPLLGTVKNGICGLSEIGNNVALRLQHIPMVNANTVLDEFIVMPNHFHAIIVIDQHFSEYIGNQFRKPRKHSVLMMINSAKGATIKWCRANSYSFAWQDKFHDHVIRNEQEYWMIKNYITNNPRNWQQDRFYL